MRGGDVEGIVAVLDPDVLVHVEAPTGERKEIRGARTWAQGAVAFAHHVQPHAVALVDGAVGLVLAPHGRLTRVMRFRFEDGKIAEVDVIVEPARLAKLDLAVLDD